jgi:hypothetical protein
VWFKSIYRILPTNQLDPIHFTYGVKVNATSVAKNNVAVEDIADAITLDGQTKVENPTEAVLLLELNVGNIIISTNSVVERREEIKDKEGNITKVNHYYRVVANYSFESSYKISKEQTILNNVEIYNRQNTQTFTSEEYNSRKTAADYWNNNKETIVSDFYRNLSINSANVLSNAASLKYGFKPTEIRDIIKTTDEKKHNENAAFRGAVDKLKQELQSATSDQPMNREVIDELIEYFKTIPAKYTDPKLKADVRIRYAAYYNLSKIYLYLDEPDDVAQYANLLIANKYDEKDGEKLIQEAEQLKAIFNKTGIHTRHFNPEEYFSQIDE